MLSSNKVTFSYTFTRDYTYVFAVTADRDVEDWPRRITFSGGTAVTVAGIGSKDNCYSALLIYKDVKAGTTMRMVAIREWTATTSFRI